MSCQKRPTVLVTRRDFASDAIELFQDKCDVEQYCENQNMPLDKLKSAVRGKNAIMIAPPLKVNAELLDAAGSELKCIGTCSVGYDHIDIEECTKRGIIVGYTPTILTDTVAELTMALLLSIARRIPESFEEIKKNKWIQGTMPSGWMFGVEVLDSVVGIVGFGRIGKAVSQRLQAFHPAKIMYSDVIENTEATKMNIQRVTFDELLGKSDFIIICCALTDGTKGLFDSEAFSKMKNNAILVNTSRGGVVNHDALYQALISNKIRGAALDVVVPEPMSSTHPLTKLPNCVITPHIGTATHVCRRKMAILTAENILAALENKTMPSRVN